MMQKMFHHNRIVISIEGIVFLMELINVKNYKIVVQIIMVSLNKDVKML